MGLLVGRILGLLEATLGDKDAPPTKSTQQPYSANQGHDTQPRSYDQEKGVDDGERRIAKQGKLERYLGLFHVFTNADKRHRLALKGAMGWAASLVVVGIIFTILCATGTFPTSVSNMKAVGVFGEYLAKYILYIVAGLLVMAGVVMLYAEVKQGRSTASGELVLYLALAVTAATIGLTIYLITKDAELNVQWWSYLIQALVLIQRICIILAIIAALWAVRETHKNEAARQAMIEGRY